MKKCITTNPPIFEDDCARSIEPITWERYEQKRNDGELDENQLYAIVDKESESIRTRRIPLNTLTLEEVIARLKAGEVIKEENTPYSKDLFEYRLIDGIICCTKKGMNPELGTSIDLDDHKFFEEEVVFEISGKGLYKTRDGRRAFICVHEFDDTWQGVVEGFNKIISWNSYGKAIDRSNKVDIISKWVD